MVLDRVDHLVRLFEDVLRERLVRLLAIPGAAAGRPQPMHQVAQAGQAALGGLRLDGRHEDRLDLLPQPSARSGMSVD